MKPYRTRGSSFREHTMIKGGKQMKFKRFIKTTVTALLAVSLICGQCALQTKADTKVSAEKVKTEESRLSSEDINLPGIDGETLKDHKQLKRKTKSRAATPYSSDKSVTQVFDDITLEAENDYVFLPITLAPGDIIQATLELPSNADIDYDLLLYEYDDAELGEEILQRGLTTYLNDYNGTKKTVDEGLSFINETVNNKDYALFVFASKGYSTTETAKLTVSLDENGYFDEFEPNDSPFDAVSITEDVQMTGNTLNVSNDQDWFVWKVPSSPKKASILMDNENYSVEMYVASGLSMVLQNPDSNGNYSLEHTYYYIKVFNKSSDFVSGSYNLKIQPGTQSTPTPTPTATPKPTPTPTPTQTPEQVVRNIKIKSVTSDTSPNKVNYGSGNFYRFKNNFTVTFKVTDASGNPVPNEPVVCVWQSGSWVEGSANHQRDGSGITDANGEVQIPIDGPPAVGSYSYTTDGPVVIRHYYDIDMLAYACGDTVKYEYMYHLAYSTYVSS